MAFDSLFEKEREVDAEYQVYLALKKTCLEKKNERKCYCRELMAMLSIYIANPRKKECDTCFDSKPQNFDEYNSAQILKKGWDEECVHSGF